MGNNLGEKILLRELRYMMTANLPDQEPFSSLSGPATALHTTERRRRVVIDGWVDGDILNPSIFSIFSIMIKSNIC